MVIAQYRLGTFGFLHYQDDEGNTQGGNYGLADLALGLKFTSENSEALGGSPDKITLNGESAGSGAVMALLLHDESAGLISGKMSVSFLFRKTGSVTTG